MGGRKTIGGAGATGTKITGGVSGSSSYVISGCLFKPNRKLLKTIITLIRKI
jgi:hypothetical protein